MRHLLLCLLCLAATPLWAEVRTPLPALSAREAANWTAIGRLKAARWYSLGFCTGALIAPDLVLTAAHCATGREPAEAAAQRVFIAGPADSFDIGERRIVRSLRHPAYTAAGRHTPQYDLGLLFLDSPLPATPIPLGASNPGPAAVLGYHGLSPFRLAGRFACANIGPAFNARLIGCPVIGGNSGSPVLQQDDAGLWHITGVISSRADPNALAAEIDDWVRSELAKHASP